MSKTTDMHEHLRGQISAFDRKCQAERKTDPDEVWALLVYIRTQLENAPEEEVPWERTAWEGVWQAGTDEECNGIREAAIRAGVLWECPCGFDTSSDKPDCMDCGTSRDSSCGSRGGLCTAGESAPQVYRRCIREAGHPHGCDIQPVGV